MWTSHYNLCRCCDRRCQCFHKLYQCCDRRCRCFHYRYRCCDVDYMYRCCDRRCRSFLQVRAIDALAHCIPRSRAVHVYMCAYFWELEETDRCLPGNVRWECQTQILTSLSKLSRCSLQFQTAVVLWGHLKFPFLL